jgi:DNA-binding protein HU-beta
MVCWIAAGVRAIGLFVEHDDRAAACSTTRQDLSDTLIASARCFPQSSLTRCRCGGSHGHGQCYWSPWRNATPPLRLPRHVRARSIRAGVEHGLARSAEGRELYVNKSELTGQVAERAGVSGAEAGRVLDATLSAIEEALASGSDVNITGFGKFSVAERAARQGVNPATGEPMAIAASRAPRFSAGAKLKQAVKS